MVKPLPINNQIRGTRRYAAPDSVYFRAWFAQKQRKDRKEGAEIQPLLLDTYSGAAAAYSLRSLTNTRLTQPVVRVRRSSDNTEQDFTAKQITNGTLVGFCGTGDGLVTTWYDQSGNSNDATQATAASQPKIVDAGVLVTENGKPALDFDGVDDYVEAQVFSNLPNNLSLFAALGPQKGPWFDNIYSAIRGEGFFLANDGSIGGRFDSRNVYLSVSANSTDLNTNSGVISAIFSDDQTALYLNQELQDKYTPSLPYDFVNSAYIGYREVNDSYSQGAVSELILYPSDQSANREAIEGNINAHYGIF